MFIRSYTGISWTRQNILAYIKQKNEEYMKNKISKNISEKKSNGISDGFSVFQWCRGF